MLLGAAMLAGCVTLPVPSRKGSAGPLPPELIQYYAYSRLPLQATVESEQERSGYRFKRLHLSCPTDPSMRPIRIDWYEPAASWLSLEEAKPLRPPASAHRRPAVLISPILAGNDLYVREFAGFFAARGLHAVIIYRPKEVFSPERGLQDLETHFHESVIQMRRAIDWLETVHSVDSQRIGSYGISLGAILTVILSAVEPRIHCSILGLPAGRVAEVIMESQDKAIRKRRKAYLERHGWSYEKGLEELRKALISEPMRFAPAIDPKRTFVIAGLFDRVLGIGRSLDLWRAAGRPRILLLPTGHYTAAFATPYLKMVTYSFLSRSLKSS